MALGLLRPIRFDWQQTMAGSRAQTDILNQVLIQSAIRSGNKSAAQKLLDERVAYSPLFGTPQGMPNWNSRVSAKIQTLI